MPALCTSEHLGGERVSTSELRVRSCGWEQTELASRSGVSKPTIARLQAKTGPLSAHGPTIAALRTALDRAGIEFLNGGSPGVRLREV